MYQQTDVPCRQRLAADDFRVIYLGCDLQLALFSFAPAFFREQQAADAEREAARQRRFGSSHGAAFHRAGDHGAAGRRRKRDFLGYYQTLGIDTASADEEAFSADAIKSAFMKMAMELHPDKNLEADEVTKRRHADRFLRAQRAYETLRDPEKRKAYDRGQLVH